MGSGIAQLAAAAGFEVGLYDQDPMALRNGMDRISKAWARSVDKGIWVEAKSAEAQRRLHACKGPAYFAADLVIEAVKEDLQTKQDLLKDLEEFQAPATLLVSNTSSLPIGALASSLKYPQRMGGLHFFNPVSSMALVEVVQAAQTSGQTLEALWGLVLKLGKTPIRVRDTPGFIVNRIARPYYLEALQVAGEGVADYGTIDALMESSGFPLGPFALMDLIGNDINLEVTRSLYAAFHGAVRFRPHFLQEEKVRLGQLGRKSGHGFYGYPRT